MLSEPDTQALPGRAARAVHQHAADRPSPKQISKKIGYSEEEMQAVPSGSNLGLGCGNPTALAAIKAGDTVLDLGSGAGFDCFLASAKVGPTGRVIGVDMTEEMVARARDNAAKGGYRERGISARRDREAPRRGRQRRCDHLQLRHQSGAEQGKGFPRGLPDPASPAAG